MLRNPKNLMMLWLNAWMQTKRMIAWKMMLNLLILKTKCVKRRKQRNAWQQNARQQGQEGRAGHGECCQHQVLPLDLQDPEVQGVRELPDVQEHQEHHYGHPAQLRQQDLGTRRLLGSLEDPWALVDQQGRIGHHGQELQVHQEGLKSDKVSSVKEL
jgi:hypothetical protein